MKNIIIYCVLLSAIFGLYKTQAVSSDTDQLHELKEIMEVVTEENMNIRDWTVYSKQEQTKVKNAKEFDRFIVNLKDDYRDFKWVEEEVRNGEYRKIVGTKSNKETIAAERIVVTAHESLDQQMVSMTYQITGDKWCEEMFEVINQKVIGNDHYVTVRTTMDREEDQELDHVASNLVESFSGEVKEGLVESHFVSVSAYTAYWGSGIAINDSEQINMQIGVRDVGNGSSVDVTIGTPIITAEY
ncbi:YwmB family TATA-box binding protein [Halalkalibacter flavus]|jgi:hypothetical protein|uniref:YwmB family TATA-box binding protein n=1 Tax=Halalkalibacter flavus TaxID=3090668 RepID=UPI002FC8CC77